MNDHDERALLAAGYALGTLTPEETASYETYLSESRAAGRERDSFAAVADALLFDGPIVTPSADLKAGLMARIALTPQLPAETTPETETAVEETEYERAPLRAVPTAAAPERRPVATEEPVLVGAAEEKARSRWFTKPTVWITSVAAAAALVIGAATLGPVIGQARFEESQTVALAEIQNAPDVQEATTSVATGSQATVLWSGTLGKSVMMIDDLEALPSDKTYELWYIGENGPVSAGTFDAASEGTTWRVLDGTMSAGDSVGVTIEPDGGSDAPTTDPIVVVATA